MATRVAMFLSATVAAVVVSKSLGAPVGDDILSADPSGWSLGHPNSYRPSAPNGALFDSQWRTDVASSKDCFTACLTTSWCKAWNFGSSTCENGVGCALERVDLPPRLVEAQTECNRTSGSRVAAEDGLVRMKFTPLKLGTVVPSGWLRKQLMTMANGLSGHLDLFWADVNDSVWIGGKADHAGAGHERGPYWLNGMVPLSALLNASGDNANTDVDVAAQVNSWIFYILDHQLPNGWLGPDDGFGGPGNTYWTGWNTAASLLQYADSVGTDTPMGKRCGAAVIAYIKECYRRMKTTAFTAWSQNRWQDWVYIIHWVIDQDAQGNEQMLWDAATLTQEQSWDWDAYYDQTGVARTGANAGKPMPKFPDKNVGGWSMYDHGVNNAMGTKSCATWYRQSHNESDYQASFHKLNMQDEFHGQPHGMFSADECFGGRNLNRGIELCAVVEQMYSLQHMFRVHGDPYFLDRCERIAFNSLPGTITPDMWQHQYLQQANEINALYGQAQHPWQTDGADSTGFGVAPNFGCCTANMQQGWPKMANNVLLNDASGGVLLGLIAPVKATINGVEIDVVTDYPFGDDVSVSLSGAIDFSVRIPNWATRAFITTNMAESAQTQPAPNGTIVKISCMAKCTILVEFNPEIRIEYGWGNQGIPAPHIIDYTASGADVVIVPDDLMYAAGASSATSLLPGCSDIRSGGPGDVSMARLPAWIFSAGHSIESVSFSFRYAVGYGPVGNPEGPTLSIVLLDAAKGTELKTIYTSEVLNKYDHDGSKGGYSPEINVTVKDLGFVYNTSVALALKFNNNKQNLQIPICNNDHGMKITWGGTDGRSPGTPGTPSSHPTNAISVLRGALLYSLPLEQTVTTIRTWAPFNNTDVDINTTDTWNYVVDVSKPMSFEQVSGASVFGMTYPTRIKLTAMLLPSWNMSQQAASEPPPSPIDCGVSGCGKAVELSLVPYGATNIRMSAMPWTK